MYVPVDSDMVYQHLEVVVGTLMKALVFALRTYFKKNHLKSPVWCEGNRVISVYARVCLIFWEAAMVAG